MGERVPHGARVDRPLGELRENLLLLLVSHTRETHLPRCAPARARWPGGRGGAPPRRAGARRARPRVRDASVKVLFIA